jgi:hypothetical protein
MRRQGCCSEPRPPGVSRMTGSRPRSRPAGRFQRVRRSCTHTPRICPLHQLQARPLARCITQGPAFMRMHGVRHGGPTPATRPARTHQTYQVSSGSSAPADADRSTSNTASRAPAHILVIDWRAHEPFFFCQFFPKVNMLGRALIQIAPGTFLVDDTCNPLVRPRACSASSRCSHLAQRPPVACQTTALSR